MESKRFSRFSRFKDVLSLTKPYKKEIFILSFILIFYSGVSLINPYLVRILFDRVILKKEALLLLKLLSAFLGVRILESVFGFALDLWLTRLGNQILHTIRGKLLEKVLSMDLSFFYERKRGEIVHRLFNNTITLFRAVGNFAIHILTESFFILVLIIVIFFLNWRMGILSLLSLPVYLLISNRSVSLINKWQNKFNSILSNLLHFLNESVSAINIIKIFNAESLIMSKHENLTKTFNNINIKTTITSSVFSEIFGIISYCIPIIALFWGASLVIGGIISVGTIMSIYMFMGLLFTKVNTLANMLNGFQSSIVAYDKIQEYLDLNPIIKDTSKAQSKFSFEKNIKFSHVSFSYNKHKIILDNIDFSVKKNERISIVGTSGAGKTTILNLLMRYFEPQKGKILIDGIDIREIKLKSLRSLISVVPQEPFLFNTSIKENILIGNPDADDKEIEYVCKATYLQEIIDKLPDGLESNVGDMGERFSGGERQRICLARALLKKAPILILDEAMSNIDSPSEYYIEKAIEEIFQKEKKTIIVFAHRLSTVRRSDRILVLKNGKIVEEGSHLHLWKMKGEYFKIFKEQSET